MSQGEKKVFNVSFFPWLGQKKLVYPLSILMCVHHQHLSQEEKIKAASQNGLKTFVSPSCIVLHFSELKSLRSHF